MHSLKKTLGRAAACGPLALALAWLPQAQPVAAADLLEIYEAAQNHDPGLQAARAQLRAAEPRAAQALAALRPSVNANASATRSRLDPPASSFYPSGDAAGTTSYVAGLTLRQALYNRAASTDVAKAGNALEIAQTEFENTEQEFMLRVAQAYFDVLAAQEEVEAARANHASLSAQFEAARSRYEIGTGIVTDVSDARARLDQGLAQLLSAENTLRVHRVALARLVGRPGVDPDPLRSPGALPGVQPTEMHAWLDRAQEHPQVRRARLAVQASRLDTERAHAGYMPTLDAVGSANITRAMGAATTTTLTGTTRNATLGLELNVPLYSGLATQNRVAETLLLEQKASEEAQAAAAEAGEATQRAYLELQSALQQATALEAARASSEAALQGTQLGYRAGVRLNLDVLNAQAQLFQAQRNLTKARYDALLGHLRLRRAAGVLTPADLAEINRLVRR